MALHTGQQRMVMVMVMVIVMMSITVVGAVVVIASCGICGGVAAIWLMWVWELKQPTAHSAVGGHSIIGVNR